MNQEIWLKNQRRRLYMFCLIAIVAILALALPAFIGKLGYEGELSSWQARAEELDKEVHDLAMWTASLKTFRNMTDEICPYVKFDGYRGLKNYLAKLCGKDFEAEFTFSKDSKLLKEGRFLEADVKFSGSPSKLRETLFKLIVWENTRELTSIKLEATKDSSVTCTFSGTFCLEVVK